MALNEMQQQACLLYTSKGAFSGVFRSVVRRQLPGAIVVAAVCALASVIYSLYVGIDVYKRQAYKRQCIYRQARDR